MGVRERGRGAVGSVDMEPNLETATHFCDGFERVHGAGVGGAGRCAHAGWAEPLLEVGGQGLFQVRDRHSPLGVDRQSPKVVVGDAQGFGGLVQREVGFAGKIDRRRAIRCCFAGGGHGAGQTVGVGGAAAGEQQAVALTLESQQLVEPAHYLALHFHSARRRAPSGEILVGGRGQGVGQDTDGIGGGANVAEEAGMAVASR